MGAWGWVGTRQQSTPERASLGWWGSRVRGGFHLRDAPRGRSPGRIILTARTALSFSSKVSFYFRFVMLG